MSLANPEVSPFEEDFENTEGKIETLLQNSNVYVIPFFHDDFIPNSESKYFPRASGTEIVQEQQLAPPIINEGENAFDYIQQFFSKRVLVDLTSDIIQEASNYNAHYSHREKDPNPPIFTLSETVKKPTDIAPVFSSEFLKNLDGSGSDMYTFVFCDACPSNIWVIYDSIGGRKVCANIEIYEYDRAEDPSTGQTFFKYGYMLDTNISVYLNAEHLSIVENEGRLKVNKLHNRLRMQKEDEKKKKEGGDGYEVIDEEVSLQEAKDGMDKEKDKHREAVFFASRMRRADSFMRENITRENVSQLIDVMGSVRRYSLRNGRKETMNSLMHLREDLETWIAEIDEDLFYPKRKKIFDSDDGISREMSYFASDTTTEFLEEILADLTLSESYHEVNKGFEIDLIHSFIYLFNVERGYLSAVLHYPWNSVGPEPMDILTEVFWFRSDLGSIKWEYESYDSEKMFFNEVWKKYYIRALKRRRKSNVRIRQKDGYTQEILPFFSRFFPEHVEHMLSLINYYSFAELRGLHKMWLRIERGIKTPSSLTLHLWKTLKWAQPSSWKMRAKRIYGHGLDAVETLLTEESKNNTDVNRRYLAPGGDIDNLPPGIMPNEGSDDEDEIVLARVLRAVERQETYLSTSQIMQLVEKVKNERIPKAEKEKTGQAVLTFRNAVKCKRLYELLKIVEKLPYVAQLAVYNRVGYSHPEYPSISGRERVRFVINDLFNGNKYKYYRCLELAGKYIEGGENSGRVLGALVNLTNAYNEPLLERYKRIAERKRELDEKTEKREALEEEQWLNSDDYDNKDSDGEPIGEFDVLAWDYIASIDGGDVIPSDFPDGGIPF